MSVRNDVINLNVNINGNAALNQLNDLRKHSADLTLEIAGIKKGTAEWIAKTAELKDVNAQIVNLKKEIGLASLSQKELINELNKLKALHGSVVPFSEEYKALSKSIKEVENRLYDVRNGVQGFASVFSKVKDEIKQFGMMAAGYLGFQFITSQFSNIINGAGKLSDSLADLQRVAGLTGDEAVHLNSRFKELDTRTSTEGLREIAIIAGKLGVAKEDIYAFTKATDMLVVSLGDELGNADQITTQLGKILNVFDGKVTGENITKLGNAFVQLANTGAATGGFIADFDQRLSGIAKSANIGLGALSGLGAGLEEMGGRVESSATAIQKLVIKIASDIPAAAKIAGMSAKDFNKLYAEDGTEAMLRYAQGLVKNKQSFAEVTASLKDAGEEGARTIETLTKLGTGADTLRGRIDLGKQSLKETSAITEAFALKNETFGATLDKLGKEFNKLMMAPGLTNFLKSAVDGALAFIKAITQIPKFLKENEKAFTLLLAGLILFNGQMILSAAVTLKDAAAKILNANATRLSALANNIAISAQAAYITITQLLTGRITLATAAQRLWNIAIAGGTGPIGIIIISIAALSAIFGTLASNITKSTIASKLNAEVQKKVVESTTEELNKVEMLSKVLKDGNVEYDNKKKTLDALIALNPKYLSGLTLENIKTAEGVAILKKYTDHLLLKAELEAKSSLLTDRLKDKNSTLSTIKSNPYFANEAESTINSFIDRGLKNDLNSSGKYQFLQLKVDGFDIDKYKQNLKEIAILQKDLTDQAKKNVEDVVGDGKSATKDPLIPKSDDDNKSALKEKERLAKEREKAKEDAAKLADHNREQAEALYAEIIKLKQKAEEKGEDIDQAEIHAVQIKYADLIAKTKDYYKQHIIGFGEMNKDEKLIAEAKAAELDALYKKIYSKKLAESGAAEYEQALEDSAAYYDKEKILIEKKYAEGLVSKRDYEVRLKQIELGETGDRVTIAKEYETVVKKAADDLKKFKKENEKAITDNEIKEIQYRVLTAKEEAISKAKLAVLQTKIGTPERLAANKALLQAQFNQDVVGLDKKSELYKLKEAELQKALDELALQATKDRIERILKFVGLFKDALSSLNTIIANKENAELARDKKNNETKKKNFKDQLDHKLISKEQYDKKVAAADAEIDAKDKALKRKQAEREKALNIFQAVINTASAVVEALPDVPLSIFAGVVGALNIAAIASQPLPELGLGDWVRNGDKHSDPSGGIHAKIERDEAVMKASAMTNQDVVTVTGTTAQITSALNSRAGGVAWAGGAQVIQPTWRTAMPAQINPSLPHIMEQGGIVRPMRNDTTAADNEEMKSLLRKNNELLQQQIEATRAKHDALHAVVSIKEYRAKEKEYDTAKKLSGLNQ